MTDSPCAYILLTEAGGKWHCLGQFDFIIEEETGRVRHMICCFWRWSCACCLWESGRRDRWMRRRWRPRTQTGRWSRSRLRMAFVLFLFYQNLPEDSDGRSRYNAVMTMNIWKIRTAQKMTLAELSELTGISKSALSNYENGYRYPTIEQLERIAAALNTSISSLYESKQK